MLNSVSLRPGEVLFTPPGGTHAYVSRLDVEIMASSDSMLRTELIEKHVDCQEPLNYLDHVAAPPMRTVPEWMTDSIQVFYTPMDDFELSVTKLGDPQLLPGHEGWVMLRIKGEVTLSDAETDQLRLLPGQTVFMRADRTPAYTSGRGVVMQSDVP